MRADTSVRVPSSTIDSLEVMREAMGEPGKPLWWVIDELIRREWAARQAALECMHSAIGRRAAEVLAAVERRQ